MDILILEDQEDDATLLIDHLKNTPLKFNYSHATNKKSYLDLLYGSSFDLVLSDYNIPGFDVEEAFLAARNTDKFIPFIVVSGFLDYQSAIRLVKEVGINDFILKDNLGRLYNSIVRELKAAKTHLDLE